MLYWKKEKKNDKKNWTNRPLSFDALILKFFFLIANTCVRRPVKSREITWIDAIAI